MDDLLQRDDEFRHMILGRLQADCEYYLDFGNRGVERLWTKDEKEQIVLMKDLYNSFEANKKPAYLTWEDILEFEREMLKPTPNEVVDAFKHTGGHNWIRTHEVSKNGVFQLFMVKCLTCGIIGKRKDIQSPIERYGMFREAKYEKCKN